MAEADPPKATFEQWCIVELFGHQVLAGRVSEFVLAGAGFLRIEVPLADGRFVDRLQNPKSVYGVRPCTEEVARAQAARLVNIEPVKPVDWAKALPGARDRFDDAYDDPLDE